MKIIKQQNGFSLLEVLIAMVILAIGLLGVAQMQITAIQGNVFGSGMTAASSLASNTIERLMGLPFTDVMLNTTTSGPPTDSLGTANGRQDNLTGVEGGVNNENYTRVYWVQDIAGRPGMRQITVRVVWTDANNKTRGVTMVTQKAQ